MSIPGLYRCAAESCPGYPYQASEQAHPLHTCGPTAQARFQAQQRLMAAYSEGEADARTRLAAALRALADDLPALPMWKVEHVAELLRNVRERSARREGR